MGFIRLLILNNIRDKSNVRRMLIRSEFFKRTIYLDSFYQNYNGAWEIEYCDVSVQ